MYTDLGGRLDVSAVTQQQFNHCSLVLLASDVQSRETVLSRHTSQPVLQSCSVLSQRRSFTSKCILAQWWIEARRLGQLHRAPRERAPKRGGELTGNCRPTGRHSEGAQSGSLAQGTRNHRSDSVLGCKAKMLDLLFQKVVISGARLRRNLQIFARKLL